MNNSPWPQIPLGQVIEQRKEFITIDDFKTYKRCRVQLHGRGIVLRDEIDGYRLRTKKQQVCNAGEFLVAEIDAKVGGFGLVPLELDGAIVSSHYFLFTIDESSLDRRFLDSYIRTRHFQDQVEAQGSTNYASIRPQQVSGYGIPLPPLDEQHRIVARIEVLAAKVDAARRLREEARAGQQALLRSVFQKIVACADHRPMAEVASIVRRWVEVDPVKEYLELGIRSFGRGTFHKPAITGLELGSKRILRIEPDDLVLMNVFAWEGAIAVARPEDRGRVGSHRYITCVPEPGVVTAPFLCFYLLTPEGLPRIRHASPGGAGRNRTLGLRKLEQIEIPVPDYSSQIRFGELQSRIRSMEMLQEQGDDMLAQLIPSILNKAFQGEL